MASSPRARQRRKKLVLPALQFKIMCLTFGVAALVVLVNWQLNVFGLSRLQAGPRGTTEQLFRDLDSLLFLELGLSAAVAIPLALWAGGIYAFRFCGPLKHIQQYFEDHLGGRWDEPLRLRKHDDLHQVKEAINASLALMGETIRRQQTLLRDAGSLLERSQVEIRDAGGVRAILSRIEEEASRFEGRLGGAPSPAAPLTSKEEVEREPAVPVDA